MADRPVLARGIECLKNDQDAVRVLGREPRLVLRKQLDPALQEVDTVLLLFDPRLEARIEVPRQLHARARAHSERLDEPRYSLRDVVCHHRQACATRRTPESAETLISCAKDRYTSRLAGDNPSSFERLNHAEDSQGCRGCSVRATPRCTPRERAWYLRGRGNLSGGRPLDRNTPRAVALVGLG